VVGLVKGKGKSTVKSTI